MARIISTDVSNQVYHVLNRANVRSIIFESNADTNSLEQSLRSVGKSKKRG